MPYTYARDDQERRITIALSGPFTADESLATIRRRRAEVDAASYGVLYDLRGLSGHPTLADLKQFMSVEVAPAPGEHPEKQRGPFAIVVTDQILYDRACSYGALGQGKLQISVFRDYQDADEWLRTNARR